DHMVRVIEDMWPVHKPDTDFGYHAWTGGWIIGEVLQRVSGQRFPELIKENLADPLGLDGLYIGLPQSELPRVAEFLIPALPRKLLRGRPRGLRNRVRRTASTTVRWHSAVGHAVDAMIPPGLGDVLGDPRWLTSVIPSSNGVFNARSLARLYGALSLGGTLDGVRLLSPSALAEAAGHPVPSSIQGRVHAAGLARPPRFARQAPSRPGPPEPARVRTLRVRRLGRMGRPRKGARRRDRHQFFWGTGPRRLAARRGGDRVVTLCRPTLELSSPLQRTAPCSN
ncbi:MAG: beta-lactamase family protein, partial [Deltaproteobacteria bacterium]|nr:beta-lactamase family protein [Deltaproteobacteria bacterium]